MRGPLIFALTLALVLSPVSCFRPYISTNRVMGDKLKASESVVPGIGDDGCRLPSPSGINMMPLPQQALVFAALSGGLYASTNIGLGVFQAFAETFPEAMTAWKSTWGLIGFIYALAGLSHFTLKKEFMNIYPARGAWGFWYLPGSKEFHVLWTGVVELLAGLWLGLGTLSSFFGISLLPTILTGPVADAATVLLSLTLAVTPANIYMVIELPPQISMKLYCIVYTWCQTSHVGSRGASYVPCGQRTPAGGSLRHTLRACVTHPYHTIPLNKPRGKNAEATICPCIYGAPLL